MANGRAERIDALLPAPRVSGVAVPDLPTLPGSVHETLSGAYEELLRYRPAVQSGRFVLQPERMRRRSGGIYYTPAPIARRLAAAALAATPIATPTVLDTAMGTGIFLREAIRALALRGRQASEIAETCIYGVDQDPLAVRLAVLSIWLETGADPAIIGRHLVCADALSTALPSADIVLGNPPWGVVRSGVDSFKAFSALATETARCTVALVLPQAMLLQSTHADTRAQLLDRFAPHAVLDLGDSWFGTAAAPACGLVFGPKPGPRRIVATRLHPPYSNFPTRHHGISAERWTVAGFPTRNVAALDLLARLQQAHPTIGALSELVKVHDTGINYRHARIARQALYRAPTPDDPRDLPRFRGRGFHRYTGIRQDGWVRHEWDQISGGDDRLAYDRTLRLLPEKIVLRQTADRVIATLDRTGMVMGRSVIAITTTRPELLLPLLACLNSRLLLGLYRALAGEEGRILPQVKVARLRAMPVPRAILLECGHGRRLASLVSELLAAEGRNVSLDQAIDAEVCALYGITGDDLDALSPL